MHILMFSGDPNLLDPHSAASARVRLIVQPEDTLTILIAGTGVRQEVLHTPRITAVFPGGDTKRAGFIQLVRDGKDAIAAHAPDFITAQDPFFIGLAALRARGGASIPLQIQLHTDPFTIAYLCEHPRRVVEYFLLRYVVKRASCIRVVSKRLARFVGSLTTAPVSVLPLFIPKPTPAAVIPRPPEFPTGKVALVASRLAPEKNLRVAIDAAMAVPDLSLMIAGEGRERAKLERYVRNRGFLKRVRFIGWQTSLAPYFAHADVFIQTSRYEGFGMSLVEAALNHCPIVGTRAGVLGEEFRAGEHALIGTNKRTLTAALIETLTNEDETRARTERSYEVATSFTHTPEAYAAVQREMLLSCMHS